MKSLQINPFSQAIAAAITTSCLILACSPQTVTAATYKLERLISVKSPASQTPQEYSSIAHPSIDENGTIAFIATTKGTESLINNPSSSLRSAYNRKYTIGIYKRLTNGQIKAVKTQDIYSKKEEYLGGGYGNESQTCTFLPPAISKKNVAFTSNCEYYQSSTYSPRSNSSKTSTLAAEINGQLQGIDSGGSAPFFSKPDPGQPSIGDTTVVYEKEGKIYSRKNGEKSIEITPGRGPKVNSNGSILFTDNTSEQKLYLYQNSTTTPLEKLSSQITPSNDCGYSITSAKIAYCELFLIPRRAPRYIVYQQQGNKVTARFFGGLFTQISNLAISDQAIAFINTDRFSDRKALLINDITNPTTEIVAENQILDGKKVTRLEVGSTYLSTKTLVFAVTFSDGSQAIYRARPI